MRKNLFRPLSLLSSLLLALAAFPAAARESLTAVTLEWDPSPAANVSGYRLQYGTEPGVYTRSVQTGKTPSLRLSALEHGTTYYFAVSALAHGCPESAPSNEISFTAGLSPQQREMEAALVQFRLQLKAMKITGKTAASMEASYAATLLKQLSLRYTPLPPRIASVRGTGSAGAVTLECEPASGGGSASGYRLLYGTKPGVYTRSAETGAGASFRVSGLSYGATYYFAVAALAPGGLESGLSKEISFKTGANPRDAALESELVRYRKQLKSLKITGKTAKSMEATYAAALTKQLALAYPDVEEAGLVVQCVDLSEAPYWNWTSSESERRGVFSDTPEVLVSETEQRASGCRTFAVQAPQGGTVEIYGSADLVTWRLLDTVENPTGMIEITEAASADGSPALYYSVLAAE